MAEETEIQQILGIVQLMQHTLDTVQKDVGTLKSDVGTLKGDVSELKENEKSLQESIGFIQENMVTKEDIKEYATKKDIVSVKSEIFEHIDGFAKQNQKFDHELIAAQSKFNRIEERVEVLELKAGIGV